MNLFLFRLIHVNLNDTMSENDFLKNRFNFKNKDIYSQSSLKQASAPSGLRKPSWPWTFLARELELCLGFPTVW